MHVPDREQVHHQAHEGDHDQHAYGQLIDQDPHLDMEGPEAEVIDRMDEWQRRPAAGEEGAGEELGGEQEGAADCDYRDQIPLPGQPPPNSDLDHERGQRQQ